VPASALVDPCVGYLERSGWCRWVLVFLCVGMFLNCMHLILSGCLCVSDSVCVCVCVCVCDCTSECFTFMTLPLCKVFLFPWFVHVVPCVCGGGSGVGRLGFPIAPLGTREKEPGGCVCVYVRIHQGQGLPRLFSSLPGPLSSLTLCYMEAILFPVLRPHHLCTPQDAQPPLHPSLGPPPSSHQLQQSQGLLR
jgi:hypothetical protein